MGAPCGMGLSAPPLRPLDFTDGTAFLCRVCDMRHRNCGLVFHGRASALRPESPSRLDPLAETKPWFSRRKAIDAGAQNRK